MPDVPRAAAIARRQHALITGAQLRRIGWSHRDVDVARTKGLLERVRRDVFRFAGAPASFEQEVLAACLAVGASVCGSHATAVELWGGPPPEQAAIHIVGPPGTRARLAGVVSHQSRLLVPADAAIVRRVPVTSAARTLVDGSAELGPAQTGRLMTDLVRRRAMRVEDVRACVARLAGPGRRKLSVVRAELARRIPGLDLSESDLEVRALRAIFDAGLPLPVQQHRVVIRGRRCYLDLAYPDLKIAIELDGWAVHGDRTAFDRDRARARELTLAGWLVLVFTSADSDVAIADAVRRARADRSPR